MLHYASVLYFLVYRYPFNGANFVTNDVEQDGYNKIFENRQIQILIYKHKSMEEASNANLDCRITDIMISEIFTSATLYKSLVDSLQQLNHELIGSSEVVTCSVVAWAMDNCASKFCHDDMYPGKELHSAVNQAMTAINNNSFNVNYKLPLNKLFIQWFSDLVQRKGYMIEKSLLQDNVMVYGKQPWPYLQLFAILLENH